MLLATRCPHCETVFRLQQEQLTLHDGLVRCGHCRQVFDATRSLVPEPTVREAEGGTASVGTSPVEAAPGEATPIEATPVEAAPAEAAQVEATPVESAPIEAAPAEAAPVEAAPIEAAPVESAQVEAAPIEAVPVESAPVGATPVDTAPLEAPQSASTPAASAPVDSAPPEPTPTAPALDEATPADAVSDTPSPTSPARLFTADLPAHAATDGNFRPAGWDMWAPWLDAGVDPSLLHNAHTIRAEPLVPVTRQETTDAGTVRQTGTPAPISTDAAERRVVEAAAWPAEPAAAPHDTDASTLPAAETDPREPRFIAPAQSIEQAGADPVDPTAPANANADAHTHTHFPEPDDVPREPRFAFTPAPSDAAPDASHAAERGVAAAGEPANAPDDAQSAAKPPAQPAVPFPAALTEDDRPHFEVTRETRAPQRRGMLAGFFGGVVAATLGMLLFAQLAWWQRESVMIYWPVTQSWYRQACAALGCKVTPPRAIDGLRLNATDLRQLDGPRVLELKAPLTNRYRVALAYPSLELTLLDDTNHVTVRRVLAPRDYVRPGTPIDAGLPPGTTQTMVVRLDTNGASASNFRVQIFYP
ncbi:TPA: zinc-ribbon domain-containing protein [Burkholderia vietnamiensis]|nr:zinc-ribbon domain-containing protein [Burkholderia vietnamiensis]HDR9233562.1 zinc-ribbon domain-containing protein [Burkholderia vietnamiensis]